MLPHLNQRFERLQSTRRELSTKLRACATPQLQFRPKPEAWSITEILHHLILVESFVVAYFEKKLDKRSSLRKVSWSAGLRSTVMTWALRSPLKFKAPSPHVLPTPGLALDDLQMQWESLRQKLQTLLERVTPEMLQLRLYRHPLAGLLTVTHMLIFLQEHLEHHAQQIEKIMSRAALPQSHPERVTA